MPSNYAHHRFGGQVLQQMPPEARRTVQRFRQMYDVGLHGPDLFFYYSPFVKTAVGALGKEYHRQSGQEFFGRVLRMLRCQPSEAAMAYLYGLLAHYCLDSVCHPFVHAQTAEGKVGHVEMEVEFDRYLMARDGIASPHREDLSRCFRLTRGECVTVSAFYPPATPAQVSMSAANTRFFVRFLAGKHRRFLENLLLLFSDNIRQQLMCSPANHTCMHLNQPLQELYDEALERYPVLLEQLLDCMKEELEPGEDFAPIFG